MVISGEVVSGLATVAAAAIAIGSAALGWVAGDKLGKNWAADHKPGMPDIDSIVSADDKEAAKNEIIMNRASEVAEIFGKYLNRAVIEETLSSEQKEAVMNYLASYHIEGNKTQNSMLNMANGNLAAELSRLGRDLDNKDALDKNTTRSGDGKTLDQLQREFQLQQVQEQLSETAKAEKKGLLDKITELQKNGNDKEIKITELENLLTDKGAQINNLNSELRELRVAAVNALANKK